MGVVLKNKEELLFVVRELRLMGKTIVTTNGCFDLIHKGHLVILEEAGDQGDVLIVGLNSDSSVRANKDEKRPLYPQMERAEILASLEWVDYVYIYDEPECISFVRLVKPDIHVNDSGYGYNCIERDAVLEGGGKLHIVEKVQTSSTSDIIKKIIALPSK